MLEMQGENAAFKDCLSTFSVSVSYIVVHIVASSSSFSPKIDGTRGGWVRGKFPPYFAGKSVNFLVELACFVRLRSWEQKKDCLIIP